MKRALTLITFVILLPAVPAAADSLTIDFEGLDDLQVVTTDFSGIVFSNAVALTAGFAGGSLNEFENPPRSGVTVLSDDGVPLSIAFEVPILEFSGFFTYSASLTLSAFDAADNLLGSVSSLYSNNQLLSGVPGSSPNEMLTLAFTQGITRILITGSPTGNSFTLDDMSMTPVPEPGTLTLLISGGAALLAVRYRSKTKNRRRDPFPSTSSE